MQEFVDRIEGPYVVLTPEMQIAAATNEYAHAVGAQPEELVGRNLFEALPQLQPQSYLDELTHLPNKRSFLETAEKEVARATRFQSDLSLLLVDVDRFNLINQSRGRSAGEDALRLFATIINRSRREIDTAARLGREEFAILLPETGGPDAVDVAQRLRREIRFADSGGHHFTASIGVATLRGTDATFESLLERAHHALHQAKFHHDRVVFL